MSNTALRPSLKVGGVCVSGVNSGAECPVGAPLRVCAHSPRARLRRSAWVRPILIEIRIEKWGSRPLYLSRKLSGKIAVPDKKDHFQWLERYTFVHFYKETIDFRSNNLKKPVHFLRSLALLVVNEFKIWLFVTTPQNSPYLALRHTNANHFFISFSF